MSNPIDTVVDDADDRLEAIAREIEIVTVGTLYQIGKRLHEAREIHSARKGGAGFEVWCRERLNYDSAQASRTIAVYENLGEDAVKLTALSRRALMDLAARSTPQEVRDDVIAKAAAGEKVTAADIKKLRDELAKAREKAVDIAAAAVDEVEESFAVERAKLQRRSKKHSETPIWRPSRSTARRLIRWRNAPSLRSGASWAISAVMSKASSEKLIRSSARSPN